MMSILNMGEMTVLFLDKMTVPQVQRDPRGLRLEKLFLTLWYLKAEHHCL